jgi:uncharacterized protein
MVIELENIFNNEGSEFTFDYELDLSSQEVGVCNPFINPFRVAGRVFNKTGVVRIEAIAATEMKTLCDRCAGEISRQMEVPIEHILVTTLNNEDNDDFILLDKTLFDLSPLVTEDIFLSLPTKLLCKNDCKGLCSNCGENLNNGQCSCSKPIDPRLEVLKQLLDNQ